MISIRDAAEADGPAIEEARRASWRAAYAGLIEQRYIDRATAGPSAISHTAPWRRTLVAVPDGARAVVGYAAFGPERSVLTPHPVLAPLPGPSSAATGNAPVLTEAGAAGETGEVYAIYVVPSYWSTGTGSSLMAAAVAGLAEQRYQRAVLWVLDANARARRFYEKAGWHADGASNVLAGLGGVLEVRYARPL